MNSSIITFGGKVGHPDQFEVFNPPGPWVLDEHRCEACGQSLTFLFSALTNPIPVAVRCACDDDSERPLTPFTDVELPQEELTTEPENGAAE